MRKLIAIMLTLTMLFSTLSLTGVAEAPAADGPVTYTHDGRVTLIDGATVDTPVNDFDAARAVVEGVIGQLGGDANTVLEPWRDITDAFGNHYYVFQQMYNNTTILGGAVKVITDASGNMLGLTASIEDNPEEEAVAESINGEQAEEIVVEHARTNNQQELSVVENLTKRMILPVSLALDVYEENLQGSHYVWVVYTDNPDCRLGKTSDLPYLAHYVTMTGEYLYSLSTIIPGDEAGNTGFDTSYVFEFMEPVNYTGYVDLSNGEEREISIDVMRDKRTGMYYLGNMERRIIVADCWNFLYNGNRVVLEYSPDNLEWDQTGLLSLYNYCQAYDYYKAIDWVGGDGLGTPIMVLNNYCDMNHTPINNAAYAGAWLGWQLFLASQDNDFSQCLDILGHEFTHCVTGSVMTYNAYMNDYGAINEAMSDIQGKTCEMMMEGVENSSWILGVHSATPFRSMEDPHVHKQPEFTWDIFYMPNVKTPTTLNDQGGVHTNSSLLNYLAYRLYEKAGMTLEEGRAFWFTVDCAMVPGTDYPQLAEILPWALKAAGLEKYETELQRALDVTRLGVETLPETFDEDRARVSLHVPEGGCFDDEQWFMIVLSVDVNLLIEKVQGFIGNIMKGDFSDLPPFIQELIASGKEQPAETEQSQEEEKGFLGLFFEALLEEMAKPEPEVKPDDKPNEELRTLLSSVLQWVNEKLDGVFYYGTTNAGQDGHTMRIVAAPGYSVPVLIHGVFDENTSSVNENGYLILLGGKWIDVSPMLSDLMTTDKEQNNITEVIAKHTETIVSEFIDNVTTAKSLDEGLRQIFYPIQGGVENELPETGLDLQPAYFEIPDTVQINTVPEARKSRPKLDESAEVLPDAA